MTRAEAGRLGGLKTAQKYGSEYMKQLGKMGAEAFHKKYALQPVGAGRYAIVNRKTNKIVNFTDGQNWR